MTNKINKGPMSWLATLTRIHLLLIETDYLYIIKI